MTQRSKRRFPIVKSLLATVLLGGGAGGAYYLFHGAGTTTAADSSGAVHEKDATLDAVVEAWSAESVAQPIAAAHEPPSESPLPPMDPLPTDSEPPQASERYAETPLPLDLPPAPTLSETSGAIARGQDPGEAPFRPLPEPQAEPAPPLPSDMAARPNPLRSDRPASGNPLRQAAAAASTGSESARDAFQEGAPQSTSAPAAAAAFAEPPNVAGAAHADQNVTPATAEEPLADAPPAEGLADGVGPLAAPPEAFNPFPSGDELASPLPPGESGAPMDMPMPPNQLRAPPTSEPLALEPPPSDPSDNEHSVMTQGPLGGAAPAPGESVQEGAPLASESDGNGRPGERALEGRQQPTLAIQKFAPSEIQVGKPCKFLVKVRNIGQRPAMDVQVHDQVPQGARLTATTPQAQAAGGQVTWDVGPLSPGEERTLEMELTPLEEGEIGSVATVTFSAAASARATCTRPQLAIRMTAPSKVMVGREQTIQIEIKNPGTGDATNVMILENVPDNLRHDAGPVLEFPVGTLRAGETRTLQLKMIAESPGRVVNTLTAHADGDLHVEQRVEFNVVAPALELAVDGPTRRYLERAATYTVKLLNTGTASAKDVRLVTRLSRGMRFVKANHMGEYDANTHAVYWSLAELPEGERNAAVELTAMPVAAGEHQLQVQCEASEGLRAQAVYGTQVEGIAALDFAVIDVEDPIEVGGETEYEVRVSNQGSGEATNLRVQATAPAGVRIISAAGDAQHRIQGGVVQFQSIPQLAPKSEMTFRIRVQGVQPGDHRLVVEVAADDLVQPVRKEESTRVYGDE